VEQDGNAWTKLFGFFAEQKQNMPTVIRRAAQGEEAQSTHRIAHKRDGGRLECVGGVDRAKLANDGEQYASFRIASTLGALARLLRGHSGQPISFSAYSASCLKSPVFQSLRSASTITWAV
jgi:hypothetical protein